MRGIPCVITAEYQSGYRIHVTFDDESEKTIDFECWLKGPVFAPLRDLEYFRRFFLDGWTIAWPNGADIAPETLYTAAPVDSLPASTKKIRTNHSTRRNGRKTGSKRTRDVA